VSLNPKEEASKGGCPGKGVAALLSLSKMPARRPLHEMTRELVAVAMGRRPADLVVQDGRWVNLCSGEIIEHTDIAVLGSRIAYCGTDASGMIGPKTEVIEAEGRYLLPGLLDAHVHIESSLLTVTEFARAVLPTGRPGRSSTLMRSLMSSAWRG
jgi:adenine deaminase